MASAIADHPAHHYALDVVAGAIVACRWVKLACERYLRDLETAGKRGLRFDVDAATHAILFIGLLKHFKDRYANTFFRLERWQQFIVWNLFGWLRADGSRRFRIAYITLGRKNGKTSKAAAIADYCFIADGIAGGRVYAAATKRDQAREVFDASKSFIQSNRDLRAMTTIHRNAMSIPETGSTFTLLGKDSKTEDGRDPSAAVIDEYHAHPDSSMYDVIRDGMGSRSQPLLLIITTAGFERDSACYREQTERAEAILEGREQDDSYFAIIYTLDKDADGNYEDPFGDETIWPKANPNLGVSLHEEYLRELVREARQSPRRQNAVLTKNFNVWTQAMTRWIHHETWAACSTAVSPDGLRGQVCYAGWDLSTVIDITAWVLCFPPETEESGPFQWLYRFFMPADVVAERTKSDRVSYDLWVERGFITATPGNVIDYSFLKKQILDDAAVYDIREIGYDPHNAHQLATELDEEGFTLVPIRQTFPSLSFPSKEFERLVLAGRFAHGNNPVMSWMVSCTEVATDSNDNIKPVKPDRRKSHRRIDGVAASINALDRAVRHLGEGQRTPFVNERTPRPPTAGIRETRW